MNPDGIQVSGDQFDLARGSETCIDPGVPPVLLQAGYLQPVDSVVTKGTGLKVNLPRKAVAAFCEGVAHPCMNLLP